MPCWHQSGPPSPLASESPLQRPVQPQEGLGYPSPPSCLFWRTRWAQAGHPGQEAPRSQAAAISSNLSAQGLVSRGDDRGKEVE